ncbi:MAG: hypothetical protein ABGW50_02075 [Thermococcus sp.]
MVKPEYLNDLDTDDWRLMNDYMVTTFQPNAVTHLALVELHHLSSLYRVKLDMWKKRFELYADVLRPDKVFNAVFIWMIRKGWVYLGNDGMEPGNLADPLPLAAILAAPAYTDIPPYITSYSRIHGSPLSASTAAHLLMALGLVYRPLPWDAVDQVRRLVYLEEEDVGLIYRWLADHGYIADSDKGYRTTSKGMVYLYASAPYIDWPTIAKLVDLDHLANVMCDALAGYVDPLQELIEQDAARYVDKHIRMHGRLKREKF